MHIQNLSKLLFGSYGSAERDIEVSVTEREVSVFSPVDGGILVVDGEEYYIPKNKKFAGYKFIIPNKFITSSNSFVKVINLPLETTIKIKKDNDIKQITLGDLK